jgi:hypothetical protein
MLTRIAMDSQTNQFDKGPVENRKLFVHPKLEDKLHAAIAYPENTAGPINAATNAPNCCAVSVAQVPVRVRIMSAACIMAAARGFSFRIAIAVVLVSGIVSAFTCSDARE